MRLPMIAICLLAGVVQATASGGLSCETDDKAVKFLVESGITRGMGGPLFNFRGTLEVKDKRVAADLRKTEFAQPHVPQYWLDGKNLKLLIYREREGDKPHGYVELAIETKAVDEGTYNGPYRLTVFDMTDDNSGEGKTFEFKGKTSCFVE